MTNQEMLEELYLEAGAYWYGVARKILPARSDQEDAVQTGFAKCLRRVEPFSDLQHAKRYVGFAVYHAAIDMSRKAQRMERLLRPERLAGGTAQTL